MNKKPSAAAMRAAIVIQDILEAKLKAAGLCIHHKEEPLEFAMFIDAEFAPLVEAAEAARSELHRLRDVVGEVDLPLLDEAHDALFEALAKING